MSRGFSDEELRECQECFGLFDKDRDGYITTKELGVALRSLGQFWTEAELQSLALEIGNQLHSLDDFLGIVKRKARVEPNYDDVLRAFKVFDREQTGRVSVEELRHILTTLGERITDAEFDEVVRAANLDPNGTIQYNDFVQLLKST